MGHMAHFNGVLHDPHYALHEDSPPQPPNPELPASASLPARWLTMCPQAAQRNASQAHTQVGGGCLHGM